MVTRLKSQLEARQFTIYKTCVTVEMNSEQLRTNKSIYYSDNREGLNIGPLDFSRAMNHSAMLPPLMCENNVEIPDRKILNF